MIIHSTAVIAEGAKIGPNVTLGPFCIVGSEVELGANVELIGHVVVGGRTKIGAGTRIFPFASIGLEPQDKKYRGESSELIIGENNTIREGVTMNPGTEGGGMITRVGDRGLFMTGAHVAHDCQVGNNVIMANNATLAGHVELGDFAFLGGLSAVHQFCRIGRHAFVGGLTGVERDVIPFGMVIGDRARLVGLNLRGLQRHGFTKEEIGNLRAAYDVLFSREGTLADRIESVVAQFGHTGAVGEVLSFLRAGSNRAICQPEPEHGTA